MVTRDIKLFLLGLGLTFRGIEPAHRLKNTVLLQYFFPDVVISASALKSIFNNFMPQLDEDWTIPIVVRAHGNKNVIYFNKTLPPTSMSTEEKTMLRCKRGARMKLAGSWEFTRNRKQKQKKAKYWR
jgi:hypothetical protein